MIHAYSLIHDDLPSMDDDDLRRGQPTCHKAFDEATAILAGDALLTLAFQAAAENDIDPGRTLCAIRVLARAAGPSGMVLGQMRDLEAEDQPIDLDGVRAVHSLKTAAMISAAFELGALSTDVDDDMAGTLSRAGEHIGMAFQIKDDILDVVGTTSDMGKKTGKDAVRGKATFPGVIGLEASEKAARDETRKAIELIPREERFDLLRRLVERMLSRKR